VLLRLLAARDLCASFFVALGPDTSGRAVFQLFRPGFLAKMRRTRAIRTYGWRTALSGTLLPARHAGRGLAPTLREVVAAGHELAVHGYNHRRWQDRLPRMSLAGVREEIQRAVAMYREVVGRDPRGFGAPGWQVSPESLELLDEMGFQYGSDTRGLGPFFPCVAGRRLQTLQLPTSFPTLDEVIGVEAGGAESFITLVRAGLATRPWNVLTLHAEMEGVRFAGMAGRLLEAITADGARCLPLERLAAEVRTAGGLPVAEIVARPIRGRAGTVAMPAGLEVS